MYASYSCQTKEANSTCCKLNMYKSIFHLNRRGVIFISGSLFGSTFAQSLYSPLKYLWRVIELVEAVSYCVHNCLFYPWGGYSMKVERGKAMCTFESKQRRRGVPSYSEMMVDKSLSKLSQWVVLHADLQCKLISITDGGTVQYTLTLC